MRKTYWYYIKKHRGISLATCFLQLTLWGLQATVNLLLIQIFAAAMDLDLHRFLFWTAIDLGCWGLYFLVGMLQNYVQAQAIRKLNGCVRKDMLESLWQKTYEELHSQDFGEYLSKLTNNIRQIEHLLWTPFFEAVGRVFQILWSILALSLIDWTLLLLAITVALLMWVIPKLFEKKIEKKGKDMEQTLSKTTTALGDFISGFELLKAFGKKLFFLSRAEEASRDLERTKFQLGYMEEKAYAIIGMIHTILEILAEVMMVLLSFLGRFHLSVIFGGGNLMGGLHYGFTNLAKYRLSITAGKAQLESLQGTLNEDDIKENQKYKKKETLLPLQHSIQLKNVSYGYGGRQILENLQLTIGKNQKIAVVGPSGSGKTTLLKCIMGWLQDYEGEILWDGKNMRQYGEEDIQREMALISQDVYLFHRTIRENLTLGEDFSADAIQRAVEASALTEVIERKPLGLETMVGEGGSQLSGGEKQRVAIARALLHNRSILLVDEGTSALDRENANKIEEALLRQKDITLLLISHHLTEERKKEFDGVYEIHRGKGEEDA
ncbi:MAG: ABC transporter ATP-binding protein [Tissierellia bacterium]|nr:ABC transporter ATP-binding protein [Tissierellia bacterium]